MEITRGGWMDLGERIAVLREEQALTQADLAEVARISPSTLSQIESGRVPRPHVGTVRKIARALGVEPADLRRAKELALPKAEAPSPGPPNREVPIYDFVHEAALRQAQRKVQAINRAYESAQIATEDMSPENDTLHYLLNRPAGEVENAYIELMRDHVQLEHENAQLREERPSVREQERTHS